MLRISLPAKPVILSMAIVLALGSLGLAQEGRRPGGGTRGGFSGGFGGFGAIEKTALLRAEQVQKELGLSEEQVSKINTIVDESRQKSRELFSGVRDLPEEERRAKFAELREQAQKNSQETNQKVGEVLNESQSKRLDEITLQVQGVRALNNAETAAKLNLTDEQKQKIRDVFEAQRETQSELFGNFRELRDLPREEREKRLTESRAKSEELRKETEKAVLDVLTDAQKQQFAEMKGAEFTLDRGALFRGGFGRGAGERGTREGGARPEGAREGGQRRRPGGERPSNNN